jgi:hypothetical protein
MSFWQLRDKYRDRQMDVYCEMYKCINLKGGSGSIVLKALCYKMEGHVYENRWGEWHFILFNPDLFIVLQLYRLQIKLDII